LFDADDYRIQSLDTTCTSAQSNALDSLAIRVPDARVVGWLSNTSGPLIVCGNGDWLTITPQGFQHTIAHGKYSGP
jgi:hypothetical protein